MNPDFLREFLKRSILVFNTLAAVFYFTSLHGNRCYGNAIVFIYDSALLGEQYASVPRFQVFYFVFCVLKLLPGYHGGS